MIKRRILTSFLLLSIVIIGIIIFNACKKENQNEIKDIKVENYLISGQEALSYLAKPFYSLGIKSLKSAKINLPISNKKIKNLTAIPDENSITAYYIVNYEGGGFTILSADKRLSPIFAYSQNSTFPNNFENCNPGLKSWLTSIKKQIEYVRKRNLRISEVMVQEWVNLESNNIGAITPSVIAPPPDPITCVDIYEAVEPLITTKWGPGIGYNDSLETMASLGCSGYSHITAGCATIAVAQVMKYHEYPANSYNWSMMPEQTGSQTTQLFIKDILDHMSHTHDCSLGTQFLG